MGNRDSKQYLKFEKERTQPSRDLIHRLDCTPRTILDVGRGPSGSASALRQRFPEALLHGETLKKRKKNQFQFELCEKESII